MKSSARTASRRAWQRRRFPGISLLARRCGEFRACVCAFGLILFRIGAYPKRLINARFPSAAYWFVALITLWLFTRCSKKRKGPIESRVDAIDRIPLHHFADSENGVAKFSYTQ